eukprot:gnl/MRDRNA2_/MRDRNA2_70454_c0_seq1.p1 gnl/MRDRNA2_/MRDRNA2_70454_c0~~gnl/MRDRNA2_/MRDRNA2_70454_c0_seq1.p1  ORF type:complete len:165 (-),score=33.64 gnl/MRDRNA2_/MRDRNA2_70454_c0_seq1:255-749(-)
MAANPQASQELIDSATEGDLARVQAALENGADIEFHPKYDFTAMTWAAQGGHLKVVEFLVSRKANMDALDGVGWSILMHAAYRGHVDVVKFLLAHGAKKDHWNNGPGNHTALHTACLNEHCEVVRVLLEAGADRHRKNQDGDQPFHIAQEKKNQELMDVFMNSK